MRLKYPSTDMKFLWLFPIVLTAEQSTIGNSQKTNLLKFRTYFLENCITIFLVFLQQSPSPQRHHRKVTPILVTAFLPALDSIIYSGCSCFRCIYIYIWPVQLCAYWHPELTFKERLGNLVQARPVGSHYPAIWSADHCRYDMCGKGCHTNTCYEFSSFYFESQSFEFTLFLHLQ